MKLERSNVEFPIWRKKVDKFLFQYNGTTIPEWACTMWGISDLYKGVSSKRDPKGLAKAVYKGKTFDAWVTAAHHGRSIDGNMVSSRETTHYRFLDGGVSQSSGYLDASSGVFVKGNLCLQYVLYKLGFDPHEVLDEGTEVHSFGDLHKEIVNSNATVQQNP